MRLMASFRMTARCDASALQRRWSHDCSNPCSSVSHLRLMLFPSTLGAAIGRGAEVVAAPRAAAGAAKTTRAECRAEAQRGEDREDQDEGPVREGNCTKRASVHVGKVVAETK